MELEPYVRVDGTPFTLTPGALAAERGRPGRVARNDVGLEEWDYGAVVFRFQDGGRLEEVTARAPVLHLGAVAVPFAALEGFVQAQDPDAFERAGFVISPRYGIAFVPGEPSWVTALAAHAIDAWRAL